MQIHKLFSPYPKFVVIEKKQFVPQKIGKNTGAIQKPDILDLCFGFGRHDFLLLPLIVSNSLRITIGILHRCFDQLLPKPLKVKL